MNALRRMLMPGPEGCPKGLASLEVRTQAVRANHDTCPLYPQREDRAAGTAISSDPHDTSSRSLWLPVRRGGKRRPQRCLSVKDTESDITVTSFCKQAFLHCRLAEESHTPPPAPRGVDTWRSPSTAANAGAQRRRFPTGVRAPGPGAGAGTRAECTCQPPLFLSSSLPFRTLALKARWSAVLQGVPPAGLPCVFFIILLKLPVF
uniref:Uncharacterized protein LOC105066271 isoform X5 n=1 Tax=Camelus bactrianus TaxID=9837 RepID=A0A9W3EK95_CAMBA|nr:uncharacterized protein LOC105066271 isoform X5 [Camelus bactrianus]